MIKEINVHEIDGILKIGGECQVIDVREVSEFNGERISGARLMPLSNFEKHASDIDRTKPVYLMCRSGNRAKQSAEKLMKQGFTDVQVIEGGMLAWVNAGLPIIKGESKVWSLERQVRFTAGLLILFGVILSFAVSSYFMVIPAFIGAGLTFAGATDWCGMGMLLAKMPWNQAKNIDIKMSVTQ